MSKYIGTPVVNVNVDTVDVTGDITTTDTTPEVIIVNSTHEDTDGGREGKLTFKGQQTGGEESTLAQIQASHDGTSDDEKGDLIFKTNDGSDGASPTEAMRIDSSQQVAIGRTANVSHPLDIQKATDAFIRVSNSTTQEATGIIFANQNTTKFTLEKSGSAHSLFIKDASGTVATFAQGGNVGIGTTSPTVPLTVFTSAAADSARFTDNTNSELLVKHSTGNLLTIATGSTSQPMAFGQGSSERVRIDNGGRLLVGKTSSSQTTAGGTLEAGSILGIVDGGNCLRLNRLSDDGDIAQFRQDGADIGAIQTAGSNFVIRGVNAGFKFRTSDILPTDGSGTSTDNTEDLGDASARFDDIFATNTSIQTSDETEKQNIASLTSAEITAATAISKLFKTYKWKDAVAAKGDNARTHTGVVAQQVQTAMSDAGLDASKYAFWCSDTWWEKDVEVAAVEADEEKGIEAKDAYTRTDTYETKDEAPEGATERTRLGIRYPELLAFVGAATEQRLTSIESRLTALEGE